MDADRFVVLGGSHLIALWVLASGVLVLVTFGHDGSRRFDRAFAIAIVGVTVPLQLLQFTPAEWDLKTSLPLQLCDWAWLVAALALWTRSRLAATITYLWGLTLTTQGIITPDLASPFPEPRWWMFWAMHVLIVWAAVYVVWCLGLHPTWRTFGQAVAITLVWLFLTLSFNAVVGTNYGYLNGKPDRASVLDLFGPWPWYVAVEIVVVVVLWALLTWPWVRSASRGGSLDASTQ